MIIILFNNFLFFNYKLNMKKLYLKEIHNILSLSKNKKGIKINDLYKVYPYTISYELFQKIINEDELIKKLKDNIIIMDENYFTTQSYLEFEEEHYNTNYLKTLFKEEANSMISIYKLLVDYPKLTYQQISNEIFKLYNIKKDIKQVSHYCMELLKIKLITSSQINTNEKINQINCVKDVYIESRNNNNNNNQSKKDNYQKLEKNNLLFDNKLCHYPQNIFNINENSILSGNKFFLSNRFSFIIDENEIKNNILFHLLLNKEKGLTANEICLLCDFIGREKSLNSIIVSLEDKKEISHKVLREGKKMEFVYFIIDQNKIDSRIKYLVNFYKNNHIHGKKQNNNEIMTKKNIEIEDNENNNIIQIKNENNILNINNNQTNFENFEELNSIDYEFILNIMKEKKLNIDLNNTSESKRKNISSYISFIEPKRNFSSSAYNRYIFIMNKVRSEKVLTLNDIKQLILEILEKTKDFVIDRKTLKRILLDLEKMKTIKLLKYELTMKNIHQSYLNEKEEIKQEKIIALRRDINENEPSLIKYITEKIKPQKKSLLNNNQKLINTNKKIKKKKEDPIQDMINNMISNSKISFKERNIDLLINVLEKILNKDKNIKIWKIELMKKLKMNYSLKTHIQKLYKTQFNNYDYPKKIFSYFESYTPSDIIIPKYMIRKKIKQHDLKSIDDGIIKETNLFKYMSNDYQKKIFKNEMKENKYFKTENSLFNNFILNKEINNNEIKENFIKKKRKFDDGFIGNTIKFDYKKWNKEIDINELLKNIYSLPGITFSKLKKRLHTGIDNSGIQAEILLYLCKMGIINIENKKNNKDFISINDDSILNITENFNLLIDI